MHTNVQDKGKKLVFIVTESKFMQRAYWEKEAI
jgi:hypothetical protein